MLVRLVGGSWDGHTLDIWDGATSLLIPERLAWDVAEEVWRSTYDPDRGPVVRTYRDTGAATAEGWRVFACEPANEERTG